MIPEKPEKPTILFLFSDTGGGHRSAAEAVLEALDKGYRNQVRVEMVDFFREYAPPPLDKAPEFYNEIAKVPQAWGLGYRLSNGNRRTRLISETVWPYVRRPIYRLVRQHPSDLIVSFHPLANAPVLRALGQNRPAFITVVTDLVSTHAFWYHRRSDLCLVPTWAARERALQFGLQPEKVKITGLPVAERFCAPPGEKNEIRKALGLPQHLPLVLLVGGGDGMGPLKRTALAIDRLGLPLALVVVTGRNRELKEELEQSRWQSPVFVYGFIKEMPEFMNAADILVTKAGPGTITEAFNAGLPMILYSRLPGQEDGNVAFVVSQGAGVWAPSPDLIAAALSNWLQNPEKRRKAAEASRKLAVPQASQTIAKILIEHIGRKPPGQARINTATKRL